MPLCEFGGGVVPSNVGLNRCVLAKSICENNPGDCFTWTEQESKIAWNKAITEIQKAVQNGELPWPCVVNNDTSKYPIAINICGCHDVVVINKQTKIQLCKPVNES